MMYRYRVERLLFVGDVAFSFVVFVKDSTLEASVL